MNKVYKYFGYCPESGFETFETKKEAKGYALSSIDYFREEASEGWPDEVSNVCWGEIKEVTMKCNEQTISEAEKEGLNISDICSGYCDYQLITNK